MKIIFDSEEQRQTFLDENCPQHFGFPKPNYHECDDMNCDECLSKYIEMEVRVVEHE